MTALTQINNRRIVIKAQKVIKDAMELCLFEPVNDITAIKMESIVIDMLMHVISEDFEVNVKIIDKKINISLEIQFGHEPITIVSTILDSKKSSLDGMGTLPQYIQDCPRAGVNEEQLAAAKPYDFEVEVTEVTEADLKYFNETVMNTLDEVNTELTNALGEIPEGSVFIDESDGDKMYQRFNNEWIEIKAAFDHISKDDAFYFTPSKSAPVVHWVPPAAFNRGKIDVTSYDPTCREEVLTNDIVSRGSKVDKLPEQDLSALDDLAYFQKQMYKGLKIPKKYLGNDINTKEIDIPNILSDLLDQYDDAMKFVKL